MKPSVLFMWQDKFREIDGTIAMKIVAKGFSLLLPPNTKGIVIYTLLRERNFEKALLLLDNVLSKGTPNPPIIDGVSDPLAIELDFSKNTSKDRLDYDIAIKLEE